ncbi:MAG: transporter substrate-binding domain-containing protein [Desulfobacteraceae bacterium]
MKKVLTYISSIIMISLLFAADIRAEEYYFVTLEYPPLEYKDKVGLAKGAAVEIVAHIMADLGHSISIEVLPWTRAVKMVKYGRADAIFTIFKNPERELFLDYSGEILIPQMVAFYARKDSQIAYGGNLEELKRFKIGVVSTISYGQKFDRSRPMLKVESTATLEQNFSKMMLGRIDLVISNVYSAEIVIDKLNIADRIKRLHPSVESVPSYIAFSKMKKLTPLLNDFDRKLIELKKSGVYDEIINKSGLKIETNELE